MNWRGFPSDNMRCSLEPEPRIRPLLAVEFEDIEARTAVDDVNQPAVVEGHVVGLRAWASLRRLRDERPDFLRRHRVGDVYDAHIRFYPFSQ